VDDDADNQVLLAENRGSQQQKCQETEQSIPDRTMPPNPCSGGRWRPGRESLRAHVVAMPRGAHRDSMMTTMNRNYLEKLELGKR
jgi:hypothetical protein